MAHEHILKMLVDGLENTADDFEKLAALLNLRAQLRTAGKQFVAAEYRAPRPRYAPKEESAARAAAHANTIADAYASAVSYFGAEPSTPTPLSTGEIDEDGVLHLVTSWQTLRASVLKAILKTYGELPSTPQLASLPGPASEQRLWAEISAWFEKLARDASSFVRVQRLQAEPESGARSKLAAPIMESLVQLENSVHRATLNSLSVAGALPYHLYRTAQGGALKAKSRSSDRR